MKYTFHLFLALFVAFTACQNKKENSAHEHNTEAKTDAPADTLKKSISKEEHAEIGGTHFTIKYHAPAVRGRTIWGGLVPYGEVWVTGAHSATTLEFNKDISVNGTAIAAGKYALFTIPGKDKWTLIINKTWDQHLADEYDPKEDVARVEITPESLPANQERLKYTIASQGSSNATISISWEKLKVTLPLELN
jgi:hypothetical protein